MYKPEDVLSDIISLCVNQTAAVHRLRGTSVIITGDNNSIAGGGRLRGLCSQLLPLTLITPDFRS